MHQETDIVIVSVIRNHDIYNRCVVTNPNCASCRLYPIDNSQKNENITTLYNRAIENIAHGNEWIVFCHEDFEIRTNLVDVISSLDEHFIYGPAGAHYAPYCLLPIRPAICSNMTQSDKDGKNQKPSGQRFSTQTRVDTLDCVCLVIHSSLIIENNLRFDENFSFDLYAEDFCIQASETFGVHIIAVPIEAHHWSNNTPVERYFKQLNYLNRKWPHSTRAATCSISIGGRHGVKWLLATIASNGLRNSFKHLIAKIHSKLGASTDH